VEKCQRPRRLRTEQARIILNLDSALVDELCQRVWLEPARRLPPYQYNPESTSCLSSLASHDPK
jgi:hypothetical protein